MRAAQMKERPDFSLMKQTDVQTIYHMQMPRWLFSDPRYAPAARRCAAPGPAPSGGRSQRPRRSR